MFKKHWLAYAALWCSGILAILACLGIILFLVIKGAHVLNWQFLTTDPLPSMNEALAGGILTPLIGTLLLTTLGILFALPWAGATAIYLAEYAGENRVIAALRTGIDVLAGVPPIVFAIFGLVIFTLPQMAFCSTMVEGVENAGLWAELPGSRPHHGHNGAALRDQVDRGGDPGGTAHL